MSYSTLLQEKSETTVSPSAIENESNRVYVHATDMRVLRDRLGKLRERLVGPRHAFDKIDAVKVPSPDDGLIGQLKCNVSLAQASLSEVLEEVAYLEAL